ncbi:2-polyprenyl-6-methoxyphenol hydroxylase-like FAD-dependent oxidoreductase [Bradyrhizobium sp. LM3.2]
MRIAVIGGGPGGLYFAYLWKKRHPEDQVDLFEQNPADATWGFGVVFSDQALEFLRADDPETVDAIAPHMESWENITLNLHGDSVAIDGVGFSSIGRLELLQFLQQRAIDAGVTPRFDTPIHAIDQLNGHDLIVAADGLNSLVRRAFEGDFGTSLSYSSNKFVWYGTSKRFDTLSQTFVKTDRGAFNAHHYRYSPTMSTFLVECDHATWQAYGFAYRDVEQSKGRVRGGVCRYPGRPLAGLQQIGLAQFPLGLERTLVVQEHGAARRRAALGAFLDRLGHAARDRGRHCAGQGAGIGRPSFNRFASLPSRAQTGGAEARQRRADELVLV